MDLKIARDQPEKRAVKLLRQALEADGWFVTKTHGNAFQSGLPDLLCIHRRWGTKWIEVKVDGGRLTSHQVHFFQKWSIYGGKIYILRGPEDIPLLYRPTDNWRTFKDNPHAAFTMIKE